MSDDGDQPLTFGASIRSRALTLGIVDDQGRATPARLADFLNRRWALPPGKQIKARTVESWFANERAPRVGRLLRLLVELKIHGKERDRVLELAAEVEQDDPPAVDGDPAEDQPDQLEVVPALAPDGTVVTPPDHSRGERGLEGDGETPFTPHAFSTPDSDAA